MGREIPGTDQALSEIVGLTLTLPTDRRQINDYRLHLFGREVERPIAFVCECEDPVCARTVVLSALAFEELRKRGEPLLFPGHIPDGIPDEDEPLAAERSMTGETMQVREPRLAWLPPGHA